MNSQNYHRVNWIDGMKINKNHFIEQDNATIQMIKNSLLKDITPINYGLLADASHEDAIDLTCSMDGQKTVQITLNKCRAVTQGGYIIDITPETSEELKILKKPVTTKYAFAEEGDICYVVLTVHPFKRVALGESNEKEEPPRHPFVLPEYSINVIPEEDINNKEIGLYHVTLGKVVYEDGKALLIEDFIPPCASIQSHQDLKYTYAEIEAFLNAMERYAIQIVQKIHHKKQTNDLAVMVQFISQNVLVHLGGTLSAFRIEDKYEPPVKMISKLMSLARVIKNSIDVYVNTGKEELLNYLSDWCDVSQGAFENTLVEMISLEYQHTDINKSLYHVSLFTKLVLSLFKKLDELDYIGKKSDSKIFVKEEVVAKNEVKNRRSFLLD